MMWHKISTAPEDRPISIVAQYSGDSDQRIIPKCMFKLDLGGSYVELHDPENVHHLSEQCEYATHWGEPIDMPQSEDLWADDQEQK